MLQELNFYSRLHKEITGRAAILFIYFSSCVLQRWGKRDYVRLCYLTEDGLMVV